jgi:hypothetical protein
MLTGNQAVTNHVFPMKEAQRDHLTQVLAAAAIPRTFQRGDAVRYIEGCGTMAKTAREALVPVFWRYLDVTAVEDIERIRNASDTQRYTMPRLDCLTVCFDGQNTWFDLACSELLVRDAP